MIATAGPRPAARTRGDPMIRIDAHQHFWRLADRVGEWPPPELAAIHRDFGPHDLLPLLQSAAIDGTVLVQTRERVEETHWMLELADRHPFVLGVVGWADLKAHDAPAKIAALAAHPKLKGLRPMLQGLPDDRWIADPAVGPAAEAMVAHGLVFDALVFPRHLPALAAFARAHPALAIVIDHAAKPEIAAGRIDRWRDDIAVLAAMPQVHCKLSGLLTEAGGRHHAKDLQPYVRVLLEHFGPARLLWGSDWPVLRLAGEYLHWLQLAETLCNLPRAERDAVFGPNAARVYRLAPPPAA